MNLDETLVLITISVNRGLVLFDQSNYGNWHTCTGINGVNLGIQISDLLGNGLISAYGRLVASAR